MFGRRMDRRLRVVPEKYHNDTVARGIHRTVARPQNETTDEKSDVGFFRSAFVFENGPKGLTSGCSLSASLACSEDEVGLASPLRQPDTAAPAGTRKCVATAGNGVRCADTLHTGDPDCVGRSR